MRHLVTLGLTQYEARVYATLVEIGESKVGTIHAESGVPRPSVYGSLRGLETRALVDRSAEDPVTFRAVPPAVALRRTREGLDRSVAAALKQLTALRRNGNPRRSRSLWFAEGRGALAERLPARLARARKELVLFGDPRVLKRLQGEVDKVASRGVRVVCLDRSALNPRKRRTGGARSRSVLPPVRLDGEFVIGIVDRKAAFCGAWHARREELAWFENPPLVQFVLAVLAQLSLLS